jgi:hypothetical protein
MGENTPWFRSCFRQLLGFLMLLVSCDLPGTIRGSVLPLSEAADQALARAQLTSSAVVSRAFVEADLMRANVASDVQREREALETSAKRMFEQVQTSLACTTQTVDVLAIDLATVLPDALPWMSDRDFFIQGIHNAQLIYAEVESYDVVVVGNGIGAIGDKPDTTAAWEVDGKALGKEFVFSLKPHTVQLVIPKARLNFDDKFVRFVKLGVKHSGRGWFGEESQSAEFHIALLPRTAATITSVSEMIPRTNQGPAKDDISDSFHIGPKPTDPEMLRQTVLTLPSGAKLDIVDQSCTPDASGCDGSRPTNPGSYCGWCHRVRALGTGSDCETVTSGPSGSVLNCYTKCEAGCVTVRHKATYHVPKTTTQNAVREINLKMLHGEPSVVTLSDDNIDGNFEIAGQTAAGQRFRLFSSRRDNSTLGLTSIVEKVGTGYRVVLTAAGPNPFAYCP